MPERLAGQAEGICIDAFPNDKRLRRITWFGQVQFVNRALKRNQPSVLVHLNEESGLLLRRNPELSRFSNTSGRSPMQCWVSVGTMVLLRIGDIWEGQRLFHRSQLHGETFEAVDITDTTVKVVKAGAKLDDGSYLIPFEEHPWHKDDTHSFCVQVALANGNYLVIPAMELIRFYFGSSSSLLSALFRPPLICDALFEQVKLNRITGHMMLDLAYGIKGASAEDVARIAGDPVAWSVAQYIGTSCLRASTRREAIYPVARFPFRGKTDLKVYGQWLNGGSSANGSFLVNRIVSCSHAFPFKRLSYKVNAFTSSRRSTSSERGQPGSGGHNRASNRSRTPDQSHLEERDASSQLAPHTYIYKSERHFPYLEGKFIRGKQMLGAGVASRPGSTSEPVPEVALGSTGTSTRIREALLVEAFEPDSLPEFLKPAWKACLQLTDVEVQLLTSNVERGCTLPINLSVDEDGVIDDELLIDDSGHFRPRQFAAILVRRGAIRLILVFIESDPLLPLAYPTERQEDVDEEHSIMVRAAKDFVRRHRGEDEPSLLISSENWRNETVVIQIRDWITNFL